MVSFTLFSLYPKGKYPWYPLQKWLDALQSLCERHGEENNLCPVPGIELLLVARPIRILVTNHTELLRVSKLSKHKTIKIRHSC
jgi:hypothetical protein